MRHKTWPAAAMVLGAALWAVCCCRQSSGPQDSPATQPAWKAEQVAVVEGMNVPESVLVDPATGTAYVSNVEAGPGQAWTADGKAFIARLSPGGKLDVLRWRESTKPCPLNAPKGMCLSVGFLYVADIDRVVRFPLAGGAAGEVVEGVRGRQLNDMASREKAVYVSDTGAGKIYQIDRSPPREVKAPKTVNGITFFKDRMFAVSWGLHEVYELDPAGKKEPTPFGLAPHFKSLDGIEVLGDGTFVVSDFVAGRVCTISPDRKTVRTLAAVKTPADIGVDRKRSLLYVPQFDHKKVVIYALAKK